jgi:tetratricopeptide (TPR) repeat protein
MPLAQDSNRCRLRQARLAVALASATLMLTPRFLAGQAPNRRSAFRQLAEAAKKANEQDRLVEAAALYSKALALRPQWKEGWWSLGTLEYDQDHYAKAAQDFQKLITLDPSNGTAHAMLGLCQFELSQDEPALKNLLKAEQLGVIKNEELHHVALYHMGVLELRARKFGDAKETLDQLAKLGVRSKELTTALGLAALLITLKDAPPEGTPGVRVIDRTGEAEALLAAKNYEQAKQAYVQLTDEYPAYPNLHFAFGRLLLETNETDAAVEQFQLELKRDPQNVSALLEIAAVRYQVDSQEALPYAEKALKLAPRLPFTHYLVGLLRLDTGNPAGAIPELEIAQKAFPSESRIYFSLGNAYARTGHKAEAAKARAEFARLHAKERERAATLYSDRPPGLAEGQLQILSKGNPQP